jgi:hypothetical protein
VLKDGTDKPFRKMEPVPHYKWKRFQTSSFPALVGVTNWLCGGG